ncbi:MAG: DUF3486 family protein [Piscinibacter sp.]|nr:DUF3486 family protein [Piscinibacter sp.]MBP6636074.1 DUF3486 family protein [Sulfuritalea sp.]
MPPRSTLSQINDELRAELDARLVGSAFGNYAGIQAWLAEKGIELSVPTIHRYGSALERKLEAVRASTHAARAIAEAAPDDADQRSGAVISLVQTEIFNTLVALQEADEEENQSERLKIISRAAQGIATLTRASAAQKRWETTWRDKARAKLDEVETKAKADNLTAEQALALIRNAYGF